MLAADIAVDVTHAERLSRALATSSTFWLQPQKDYDRALAKHALVETLAPPA